MSTPAEKTKAANEDALRHMHRVRGTRLESAQFALVTHKSLTRRFAAPRLGLQRARQTKETEDTRFSNPPGHVAEKPGGPHQVGAAVSREAHDEPRGARTQPPPQQQR